MMMSLHPLSLLRLERCNPWPHVATCHHHAQSARVCRPFSARQSRGCAYRPTSVNVYTVCCHGHMCMCKYAHLYRSVSAARCLTRKRVSTTPSQPQIRRPLPSQQRYRHIPELTCEINSIDAYRPTDLAGN